MGTTDAVRLALSTAYVQKLLQIKARQLASRPEFRYSDRADIEHDLIAHVLQQAGKYDPARACVNTFIIHVVETAVAMEIRKRGRLKRAAGYHAASLEDTFPPDEDEGEATLGEFVSESDLRRRCGGFVHDPRADSGLSVDVAGAMAGLTPRQREIAKRLVEAKEATIAREMGISRRRVRSDVLAIRKHFRQAGLVDL